MLALDAGDFVGNARAKLRGNDFSIDDPGRHLDPFASSPFCP
jgi:hypothetical protein